jgi:GNAT superfamily N-acetyltransferase
VTHPAWGQGLGLEAWLRREKALRAHRWSKEAMTTWLWMDGERCLSSCETFRVESAVGGNAGVSFAVASVFTEPELRGRGAARAMMQALVARLSREPTAQAVVLYSEVGTALYEAAGFRALEAFDAVWAPSEVPPVGVEPLAEPLPAPPALPPPPGVLELHPGAAQLDWHLERERFYAAELSRRRPAAPGARLGGSSMCWAASYKSDELVVLWRHLEAPAHLEPLLAAARFAACEAGVRRLRLWEAPGERLPDAQRVPRTDEVPMFAPLSPSVSTWVQLHRGLWV